MLEKKGNDVYIKIFKSTYKPRSNMNICLLVIDKFVCIKFILSSIYIAFMWISNKQKTCKIGENLKQNSFYKYLISFSRNACTFAHLHIIYCSLSCLSCGFPSFSTIINDKTRSRLSADSKLLKFNIFNAINTKIFLSSII